MRVRLLIVGDLARRINPSDGFIEISEKGTIEEAIREIGLELNSRYIFVIDKKVVKKETQLFEGAIVTLFPFVSGG
jgi:sulfur carrier protein ThiS